MIIKSESDAEAKAKAKSDAEARDAKFYAEQREAIKNGYVPLKRLAIEVDELIKKKWTLADRKHFAQWKLRKIRKEHALLQRKQNMHAQRIEEERISIEEMFWKEAPIMRPKQWSEWEKYNWPKYYAQRRTIW